MVATSGDLAPFQATISPAKGGYFHENNTSKHRAQTSPKSFDLEEGYLHGHKL
jgi:hypothetical protein